MTQLRDCVICAPIEFTGGAEPKESIRATCGVCRRDVWVSKRAREQYTGDPDQHVLACIFCGFEIYLDLVDRQADLHIAVGENNLSYDFKRIEYKNDNWIVLPTWMMGNVDFDIPYPVFKDGEET
jgi:hypothetical protein